MVSDLKTKKNKVEKIFRYIKALNELRNPVSIDLDGYNWTLFINEDLPKIEECESAFENENLEHVLRVRRSELIPCPRPEDELISWLESGWDKLKNEPIIIESKTLISEDGEEDVILYFDELEGLRSKFEKWKTLRDTWKLIELEKTRCIELYDKLFSLHSMIQRDSESLELLLGDGFLTWRLNDGRYIKHPMLLQKLKLEFDPSVPEFIMQFEDGNTELYIALLRTIKDIDKRTLSTLVDDLKENNYQILEHVETNSYLKRFITSIISSGKFIDVIDKDKFKRNQPILYRKPVIFLRKRTLGYSVMIDAILDDIKKTYELPPFIDQIIGEVPQEQDSSKNIFDSNIDVNGIDQEILLSKPANKEQLYVAKILERYGAVLVQGPPGTGKTHTIANIIGHLLSEGKSILVTSHTEKALSVLKEKIQDSIQPLCLSVTGSRENRKGMDYTLNEMNLRLSNINELQIQQEIKSLKYKRKKYLDDLKKLREDLFLARDNEYKDIIIAGKTYKPIKAAKMIKEYKDELIKIPSPVQCGAPFPLNNEDLLWLYRSNKLITSAEEYELFHELPKLDDLMVPEYFQETVEKIEIAKQAIKNWDNTFWEEVNIDSSLFEKLSSKVKQFEDQLIKLDDFEIEIIDSGIENGSRLKRWKELFEMIIDLKSEFDMIENIYLDYDPKFEFELSYEDALKNIDEIIEYLGKNKKLNKLTLMIKKHWKEVIEKSTVNGKAPQKQEEFIALKRTIAYCEKKDRVFRRWSRQIPEETELHTIKDAKRAFQYVQRFTNLFLWYSENWFPLLEQLINYGFKWKQFSEKIQRPISQYAEIGLLKEYIKADLSNEVICRYYQVNLDECNKKINNYIQKIRKYVISKDTQVAAIVHAMENYDVEEYKRMYQGFIELIKKTEIVGKRKNLIQKIMEVAPSWANAIKNRLGIHGEANPPEDMNFGWLIRQFHDELKRRHELDMEQIQVQIHETDQNLKNVTEDLVDRKAWFEKVSRTTHSQIQAIEGWRGLIKKVGRGTGKRVPKLLAEARKLMPVCQTAIPVWIMPLSKVVENFDPSINRFDVVIIDEASQADIMAMNAVYLAKQVIIVGDDEQVSPSAVGQNLDQVQALIDTYLDGIPNSALYDGQFSIYDLARTSGFKPVTLTEHFRCVPTIIRFSNYLSYNGNIKPLRDESDVNVRPSLVEYRVDGGFAESKINAKEAEHIAALILAATRIEQYKGMTFGVISLVGDKQAAYIDRILQRKMNPVEYIERRIQCGNPATFQGDERDVIFLSMVDSPKEDGGPISLRSAESRDVFKKRYNVATSRAKDQMWVVHSLDVDHDLKEDDIRRRLIKHVQDPDAYEVHLAESLKEAESPFETEVMTRLISAGFKAIPQWDVGSCRIDMVVEGAGKRLAIECDGEKWHTFENLSEDMQRQAILERLGWTFVRIRGSEYYLDPDNAMKKVFDRLNKLNIKPELNNSNNSIKTNNDDDDISNEVIRIAHNILKNWDEEDNYDDNLEEQVAMSSII